MDLPHIAAALPPSLLSFPLFLLSLPLFTHRNEGVTKSIKRLNNIFRDLVQPTSYSSVQVANTCCRQGSHRGFSDAARLMPLLCCSPLLSSPLLCSPLLSSLSSPLPSSPSPLLLSPNLPTRPAYH